VAVVSADPARLRQILWNLVNNAIKFSDQGGTIELHLQKNSDCGVLKVTMSVVDHGIGISKEFLPRIFERFTQENISQSREPIGLGLGLAIVRNLVELHGGRIWAESPGEGQGATFFVELPAAKPNADLKPVTAIGKFKIEPNVLDQSPEDAALNGIEVLLVDDDADTRDVLTIALETYGAKVQSVATTSHAFEALSVSRPHVVISDIAMPGEDGYSFIAKLRAKGSDQSQIPAIALSAYADPDAVTRAITTGFSAHLAKPIKLNRLINTIKKLAAR
jgi:CheY-like chemotaxis protein